MFIYKKENFSKIKLINFLIVILPLSLIIGNLATNINIILIIIFGFSIYKTEIFFTNNKVYNFLLYLFFFYLISITFINNFDNFNSNNTLYKEHFYKSMTFLRFLFLFFVINKLLEKNVLNIKLLFLSFSSLSAIIAIDIVYQVIFGANVIGLPITIDKPSSFFGEENIAGGYLQKFLLFTIIFIIIKFKNYISSNFLFFLFIIFLIPIFLTSNRMSLILYMFSVLIFYIFEKKLKKIILISLIFIALGFAVLNLPFKNKYSGYYFSFAKSTVDLIKKSPKLFIYGAEKDQKIRVGSSGYLITFYSGVQLWKENKIFGAGLKSFRINCKFTINQVCNTHPHNYFLEILLDLGIVGLFIIYLFFCIGAFNFLKTYYSSFKEKNYVSRIFPLLVFIIIFIEFFPFRSSGSFFTTNNATIIFFLMPFFLNSEKINIKI